MARAMECQPLTRFPRRSAASWLQRLIGRLLDRAESRPTPLEAGALSPYLMKDLGLETRGFGGLDPQRGRSPMDWPMR